MVKYLSIVSVVTSIIIVIGILFLTFYARSTIHAEANISCDKSDMQPTEGNNYCKAFIDVLKRHLGSIDNGDILMDKILEALSDSEFTEAYSKARIGWIGEFKVVVLQGENKLFVKDAQSIYYNKPDKLTIGDPYSEQVIFLNGDKIFYLEEISDVNKLDGFIVVLFARKHIYYLDLIELKGGYFVRSE